MSSKVLKQRFPINRTHVFRLVLLVFFALFIALPLAFMLGNMKGDDFSFVFRDGQFGKAVGNSFLYSSVGALLSTALALVASFFLSRAHFKHSKAIATALTISMFIPTLSIGLGVRSLFGTNGFFDKLTGISFDGLGFFGLILGSTVASFPVAFTMLYDAMRYEDKRIYDVSKTMGTNSWQDFVHITLPYLAKPLVVTFFASFTWIFADYGIPMEVAGKIKTLPMYLYEQVLTQFKYGRGAVVGLVLLLPAVVAFVVDVFFRDNFSQDGEEQIIKPTASFKVVSGIILAFVGAVLFLPQLCFIILAFVKAFPNDLSFSLQHFADGFSANAGLGIWAYLGNSLLMAFITGLIGTILAYLAAYASSRMPGFLSRCIRFVSLASLTIPGLVYGIGFVFLFKDTKGWFYGTVLILCVVNVVHFFATPYLMASNALSKMNKDYETVGETMGISRTRVFFHVLLPNSVSTLLGMFSFFFVNSMITISAVAFLCTYANQPLSILISTFDKQGSYEMQAVVSVIILGTNIVCKAVFDSLAYYFKKRETPQEDIYMALTRYEFDFLTFLERSGPNAFTQRALADELRVSIGLVNKMLHSFEEQNVIQISADKTLSLTEKGTTLLEPYRVRKAIVVAAGFGSRLAPVTLDTPKPLVKVNGVRIIDTLLDALIGAGITAIYIVRGYKKEQFDQLLEKYPMVQFIDNPLFNETNNISSVYAVRDLIDRCYICEADLIVSDPSIITKYQFETNYLACPVKETDDWCFQMYGSYIKSVRIGGENVEQMVGISYWNEKDSEKLREDIVKVWNSRGGKENYWDSVPLSICHKDFSIAVRECDRKAITEIDNYSELIQIDPSYEKYPGF